MKNKNRRFILLNKKITNRKNKIKEIIKNWNIQHFITDEVYLSIDEIDELFKKINLSFLDWIKEESKYKLINYHQALEFQKIVEKSNLSKNSKRQFFELSEKWKTRSLSYFAKNEIKIKLSELGNNLLKHKTKLPLEYVQILEEEMPENRRSCSNYDEKTSYI